MAYQTVTVLDLKPGYKRGTGQPFMKVTFCAAVAGAEVKTAYCFRKTQFEDLEQARVSAAPVVLDISESAKADDMGEPFLRIDGFESPNQLDFCKEETTNG